MLGTSVGGGLVVNIDSVSAVARHPSTVAIDPHLYLVTTDSHILMVRLIDRRSEGRRPGLVITGRTVTAVLE